MRQNKKLLLLISLALSIITFVIVSILIYIDFKETANPALIGDSTEVFQNYERDLPVKLEEQKKVEVPITPLPSNKDGSEIDYNSISGLTEGRPYGKKLVEDGSINILLIGENKFEGLCDTISIVSIDKKSRKVRIIMIPRDTYIEYNKKVLHYLEKEGKLDVPGMLKINAAHNIGPIMKYEGRFKPYTSISFLADVINEKFNIEVDDYVKVDTDIFAQIVDLFGGIKINVPYEMNYDDPGQNLSIHLEKGEQNLDGKQAEGFVRFRQGYNEKGELLSYGDIERKKNQIAFLKAFIDQHGTINNINKTPELLKTLGKKMLHSIGVGDVLFKYMGLMKDIIEKDYEIEGMSLSGELKWINRSQYMVLD